jgi:CTP:molybdopterin cytidylyltransferase MocA
VQRHASEGIDVEVDDPGVLLDIDEPADYERAVQEMRALSESGGGEN